MAQFSVNPTRFDPYKNFKFRVKWDARYVAGVSKVGALKRTTEVVKHREGGDPSSTRKSPGRTEFEAITFERGVTHDPEFEKWRTRYGASVPGSAPRARSRTSGRTSSSRCTTRLARSSSPTGSSAAGCRSFRHRPTWMPMRTPCVVMAGPVPRVAARWRAAGSSRLAPADAVTAHAPCGPRPDRRPQVLLRRDSGVHPPVLHDAM
jgi:hypothetical protein